MLSTWIGIGFTFVLTIEGEINGMPPTQEDWDLVDRFLSNGYGNVFSSDLECGACDTSRCETGTSLFILMDRGYCGRLTPV